MSAVNSLQPPAASPGTDQSPYEPSMEEILASIRRIIADDQSLPGRGMTPEPAPPNVPAPEALEHGHLPIEPTAPTPTTPAVLRLHPEAPVIPAPMIPPAPPVWDGAPVAHGPIAAPQFVSPEGPDAPFTEPAPVPVTPAAVPDHEPTATKPALHVAPAPQPEPEARHPELDHEAESFRAEVYERFEPDAHEPEPNQPDIHEAKTSAAEVKTFAPEVESFATEATDTDDDLGYERALTTAYEPQAVEPTASPAALFSTATDQSVSSAFATLAATRLADNSDELLGLAREMIRPLLKTWLDDNLPSMVERMVRAEIERVSRGGK